MATIRVGPGNESLPIQRYGETEPLLQAVDGGRCSPGDDEQDAEGRGGVDSLEGSTARTETCRSAESPASRARMGLVIASVGLGVFLCALDQLLVASVYARIGSELNALNNTSWIATGYFLTLTSFQPLYGRLSDIFGRKQSLLFSYVIFGLGSLGCGLSQTIYHLVAARAVAGIGGGGMNSVVTILVTDLVPLRDRGIWQGYLNLIFAAGTATGAPLGGWLADTIGWRWSFIGQAPLCLMAFILVYFVLDLPRTDHSHWLEKLAKVDFLGAMLLVSAIFTLLLGLDHGSNHGWADWLTLAALTAAPALFGVFLVVESKVASHPFAPGHIIFDRALLPCYAANFFGMAGQLPPVFNVPLFLQTVRRMSASRSGTLLMPPIVMGVLSSVGSGLIIKRTGRYYAITIVGFSLMLLSTVPMVLFSGAWMTFTAGVVAGLVILSLGTGTGITTTLISMISNCQQSDVAIVIACSYLFRSLGSSIGIAVSSATQQQVLRMELIHELGDKAGSGIVEQVRKSIDVINNLDPDTQAIVRKCYQTAAIWGFLPSAVFLSGAVVAAIFIKEKRIE